MSEFDEITERPDDDAALAANVRHGVMWSLLNNLSSRLASIVSGIILARLLVPEDYGVFAVALVVLTALLSMNELGVSVAIVRWEQGVERIAPTVTTLAVATSVGLYVGCFFAAPTIAAALNAPEATNIVRVLGLGVLFDGAASVSAAFITRAFDQRKRMRIDLISFAVGTSLSVGLAIAGWGGWSIALGFLLTSIVAAGLNILWTPTRIRPGYDRAIARELLEFGLPLAAASLLLFALLNVDYIVVGNQLDAEQLGIYLLAFNLSSWPISLVSVAIRRVSLAGFSRIADDRERAGQSFARALGVVLAVTLPMCVLLGSYAASLIEAFYGAKWLPAADVVSWLCVLACVRIIAELGYDYLVAMGRTTPNLVLQIVWFMALVPALVIGARVEGIVGVAIGHGVVGLVVVVPLLIKLLADNKVTLSSFATAVGRPLVGSAGIAATALIINRAGYPPFWTAAVGGTIGLALYLTVLAPARHRLMNLDAGSSSDQLSAGSTSRPRN
jgi:O-antigen/teichoic acid export membrane protein